MAERREPITRAASTSVAVGVTAGKSDTTADVVKVKKDTATCPNCERVWPATARTRGTTIPCLCGFQLSID